MTIQRATYDIEIYRGDTPKFRYQLISVDNDSGVEEPVDISNFTISAQVRRNADSPDIWYTFPIVIEDALQGKFAWQISKGDSEQLLSIGSLDSNKAFYDIQIEVDGAVFTFMQGSFVVTRDTTRG